MMWFKNKTNDLSNKSYNELLVLFQSVKEELNKHSNAYTDFRPLYEEYREIKCSDQILTSIDSGKVFVSVDIDMNNGSIEYIIEELNGEAYKFENMSQIQTEIDKLTKKYGEWIEKVRLLALKYKISIEKARSIVFQSYRQFDLIDGEVIYRDSYVV